MTAARLLPAIVLELLVDVAAGGKGAAGAGQHDAADRVVGVEAPHRLVHLADETAVHRVELLGPVQRDGRHVVGDLDADAVQHETHPERRD